MNPTHAVYRYPTVVATARTGGARKQRNDTTPRLPEGRRGVEIRRNCWLLRWFYSAAADGFLPPASASSAFSDSRFGMAMVL